MAHPVAETFIRAADLVANDDCREGNWLSFDAGEKVVYTGDIHGNRQNLTKILSYADVGTHPNRRLVLQELIHGGAPTKAGNDRSVELLLRAARLKIAHPERVFFLMGNHDLAQFTGSEITKSGGGMCRAFDDGLIESFGPDADEVRQAVNDLLCAMPLAGRCAGGTLMAHSLPSPGGMGRMDWTVFDRPYQDSDLVRGGSVYEWLWGRGHTAEQLAQLREKFDATFFLVGHQPVDMGYEPMGDCGAIIASEGPHGQALLFDAGETLDAEELPLLLSPIVAM